LTRLTATAEPTLTLIRLLFEMHGTSFETCSNLYSTSGFLFDMNLFFQRLLSRFLRENLDDHWIKDEYATKGMFAYAPNGNPRGRSLPRPRLDFALFKAKELIGFLDAKYRDVWERGYSPAWLYQLSVYALSSPNQKSILLYATMSSGARDEQVDIRHSTRLRAGSGASVIMRPVQLETLASLLVSTGLAPSKTNERRKFARSLIEF
jgi:5-methylcytosine-specific restriction enzyme subunit McrC